MPDVRRVLAYAFVVSLHAAILIVWSLPSGSIVRRVRPVHDRQRAAFHAAIEVRWLPAPQSAKASPDHVTAPKADRTQRLRPRRKRRLSSKDVAIAVKMHASTKPARIHPLDLALPASAAVSRAWHVGRVLKPRHRAAPRVPGHDPVPGMPVFAMADPRMSGVAGAVRIVQGILGAVDPRCVDVDAWRGMTADELHKHHQTRYTVEAMAHRHGCRPPQPANKAATSAYWH